MIDGAAQADIGVLITSARSGEFEDGFEKGGQTREHAILARTLGVNRIIVAVNKMDDETCKWSETRFNEIQKRMTPYLKACGFPEAEVKFIPISGLKGENVKFHVSDKEGKGFNECGSWYGPERPTLLQLLDTVEPPARNAASGLRVPLLDGYRDSGVMTTGKIEQGTVNQGMQAMLMPGKLKIKVVTVSVGEEEEVCSAPPGENVIMKMSGCEETDVVKGCVLCPIDDLIPVSNLFKAQIRVVELLEKRPILSPGYQAILHMHTASAEVMFESLLEVIDVATKKKKKNPTFIRNMSTVIAVLRVEKPVCLEEFAKCPQLGRLTIRDEEKTIAIGKVLEVM
eukprot:Selendium_serpulae@DN5845_c0_g2_i1.p1